MATFPRLVCVLACVAGLFLLPRPAAAQLKSADKGYSTPMGVCEGVSAAPVLGVSGFVGGRMIVDVYTDHRASLLRSQAEGDALLGSAGVFGAGYLGCGPAMHFAHGRPARALASFGLRTVLPAMAILLTSALDRASNPDDGKDHSAAGLGPALFASAAVPAAFGAAMTIDHAILAAPDVPTAPPPSQGATFYPSLSIAASSAIIGMGGAF